VGNPIHDLKVWPPYFDRILDGSKTFEIRRNDRDYQPGELLRLSEYNPDGDHDTCADENCRTRRYTGRTLNKRIGFVVTGTLFGLDLGPYAVLSLLPPGPDGSDATNG
jgi:hypothetical protein